MQVLRDLGISEARLKNSMLEVWNKTDLLPSEAVPGVEAEAPTASTSTEGVQTGIKGACSFPAYPCIECMLSVHSL